MDHAILDVRGRRAGRVDDLELEVLPHASAPPDIVLRSILSGPLPRPATRPLYAAARFFYRICGVLDARPARVEWRHVDAVDALVHLDVDRIEAGLRVVDESVLRFVAKIPGSGRKH